MMLVAKMSTGALHVSDAAAIRTRNCSVYSFRNKLDKDKGQAVTMDKFERGFGLVSRHTLVQIEGFLAGGEVAA